MRSFGRVDEPRAFTRGRLLVHLLLVGAAAVAGCTSNPGSAEPAYATVDTAVTYWPVALLAPQGRVEMYQPQPQSHKGDQMTARAAVSLTRTNTTTATFGAVWFSAHIHTDRDTRTVTLDTVKASEVRLPGSTAAEQQSFAAAVSAQLSMLDVMFPLDQLMASLDTVREEAAADQKIATAPPRIVFSTTPATLILINGAPRVQPVEAEAGVSRVANTPFILLVDDATQHYYLKAGPRWVTAPALPGPWADTATVPPAIGRAGDVLATPSPQSEAATQPGAAAPTTAPTTTVPTTGPAPQAELSPAAANARIIVATDPTELIVTSGNPQFTPIPGSAGGTLLYASNTESNLFLDQTDRKYYVLLSGRWYSSALFEGPWAFAASDHLPAAFAEIPPDSPRADVLPFVAGTTEAREAVLDASVPQTAAIRRDAGADLTVSYDGQPQFKDVPESPGVAYALNTPEEVLRVSGRYYCCHQAVWYESDAAIGPWAVCTSVPREIYTLPPSCPVYNVRYVSVYDYYPEYVTCGYLPGYTGTYVYGPTIVYGTGYDYPGWFGTTYFPPPCTWGFGAYYDPFVDAWGFDLGLYWGAGWFCHPWRDRWWHDHPHECFGSHRWWGPGGFVHSHDLREHLINARRGDVFRGADRLTARLPGTERREPGWQNLYARRGNLARNLPADRLPHYTRAGYAGGVHDNLFSGNDGRVFRRMPDHWEENRAGAWNRMDRVPEARDGYREPAVNRFGGAYGRREAGLGSDFAARSRGEYRSGAIHSFERGGGGFRGGFGGGGFRGGGGGFHGGGGRR